MDYLHKFYNQKTLSGYSCHQCGSIFISDGLIKEDFPIKCCSNIVSYSEYLEDWSDAWLEE